MCAGQIDLTDLHFLSSFDLMCGCRTTNSFGFRNKTSLTDLSAVKMERLSS
jgi:hypothetical protein